MTVRVAVSVEGTTERAFVKEVLQPYLIQRSIYLFPKPMNGNVSLDTIRRDVVALLKNHDYVTTLCDLYGFKGRNGKSAPDLEAEIAEKLGCPKKFIPYVQPHEFEALIFAGPDEAGEVLSAPDLPEKLRRILQDHDDQPERINDGYDTCPSRRLKRECPRYNKVLHGHPILARIGLTRIREKCPRFGAWLTRLEALA